MALTSVDLLSGIVTAWPAGLGGLGALAVDSRRGEPLRLRSQKRRRNQFKYGAPRVHLRAD
jgi:hypothetical protein